MRSALDRILNYMPWLGGILMLGGVGAAWLPRCTPGDGVTNPEGFLVGLLFGAAGAVMGWGLREAHTRDAYRKAHRPATLCAWCLQKRPRVLTLLNHTTAPEAWAALDHGRLSHGVCGPCADQERVGLAPAGGGRP